MKCDFKRQQIVFALMAVLFLGTKVQAASYTVTRLDGFAGGGRGYATALNSRGQVVGYGETSSGVLHAALWEVGSTTPTDLGYGRALGINASGQVVGTSINPVFWEAGSTTPTDLVGGVTANSINASGQIVGWTNSFSGYNSSNLIQATVWQAGASTVSYLGAQASYTYGTGINTHGQVVGYASTGGILHAVLWQSGSTIATELGVPGAGDSSANSINDNGQVVGWGNSSSNETHALLWQANSNQAIDLSASGTYSNARSINASGQVVGWVQTGSYYSPGGVYTYAALWQPGSTQSIDLNTLVAIPGVYLTDAIAINDIGQILLWDSNSFTHLLLTPAAVPIPSAIWFFGSAIAGFIGFSRRKIVR